MNYYIDTEFLEGTQKEKFPISLFRKKTKPTIDLISIGIVSEDGREYYAISKDFNLKEAWNRYQMKQVYGDARNRYPDGVREYWIRENVLKPIWRELIFKEDECCGMSNKQTEVYYKEILTGAYDHHFTFKSLKTLIKKYGKTNKEIAEEIQIFTTQYSNKADEIWDKPKFYAYYADYDWVAFCWLFGKMIDLPNGFPMYCNDLKQDYDFFNANFIERKKQNAVGNIHESINELKDFKDYPKQENEHNALDDARWNKKLHEFLNKIK